MDLGHLQMTADGRLHRDEVIVTAEPVEEGAEVGKAHDIVRLKPDTTYD
jgi:hypothetical protein